MKGSANGISPVVAIIVTLIVAALCVWMFTTGHIVWGIIFGLITIDFFADVVLSFQKA